MTVYLTGVAVASVGTATTTADANVPVSGLQATGNVGQVLVWGTIVPNQNAGYNSIRPKSDASLVG
jgi:hypothetical protein